MTASSKGACPRERRLKGPSSLKNTAAERLRGISLVVAFLRFVSGTLRRGAVIRALVVSARVQTCSLARHHRARGASGQVTRRDCGCVIRRSAP